MKLSDIAREIRGSELVGGDAEIASLCTDSRVAGAGDLFFCIRGTQTDGHAFAAEAEARGAAGIVCEHKLDVKIPQLLVADGREGMSYVSAAFYGHPERSMKMIGVTGTNGKTTVTHMLFEILRAAGRRVGRIGTLGAQYGETTVAPALTTPDPVGLFSLLAKMRDAQTEVVVMEVSAHALALKKELPIFYEAAIFTNLTQDHLDFFGDMQAYGEAKRSLFSPERCRLAVLNADDPFSVPLGMCGAPCLTYGLENPSDCFAVVESENLRGSRALFNLEDDLCETEIRMAGRHNVYNALAAAATARRLGADEAAIAKGLSVTQVDGRLERVGGRNGADIFVDFAHTPDGLEKSLSALREFCDGRLCLVFGCGGNRDRAKRPLMGEIAAKNADFTVITSDNPRYEDACAIISEIESGFRPYSDRYVAMEERDRAIAYAIGTLGPGDVLLVAGKGGETVQEIMGIKYSYNDKAVIKSCLENRHDL